MDLLTQFYVTVALMIFSGGLGYYMGERGISGVKIDIDNTKNEIEKVKNLVTSKTIPQAVTIVTPEASHTTTPTTTITTPPSI
jgi:hypothetical protein